MATKLLNRVFKLKSIGKAGLKGTAFKASEDKGASDRLGTDDLLINDVGIEGGKIIGTDESKLIHTLELPPGKPTENENSSDQSELKSFDKLETFEGNAGEESKGIKTSAEPIHPENNYITPFTKPLFKARFLSDEKSSATVDPPGKDEVTKPEIVDDISEPNLNKSASNLEHEPIRYTNFSKSIGIDDTKPIGFSQTRDLNESTLESDDFKKTRSEKGLNDVTLESRALKKPEVEKEVPKDPFNLPSGRHDFMSTTPPEDPLIYKKQATSTTTIDEKKDKPRDLEKDSDSKKPLSDFNPNFVDPTPDRKLNLGRTSKDDKKEAARGKQFFLEKSETEGSVSGTDKDPPKKASGVEVERNTYSDVGRNSSTGIVPDLISPQNYHEFSNKHYDIDTLQSMLNAKSTEKHGTFNLGKLSESSAHSKPFPVDAINPLSIPGYTPSISEKPFLPKDFFKFMDPPAVTTYDLVPGPTLLRTLGNIWKFVPLLGTQFVATLMYTAHSLIASYDRRLRYPNLYPYYYLLNKYGPMVRLHGPIGADILLMAVNGQNFPLIHAKLKNNRRQSLFDSLNLYRRDAAPLTYMLNVPKTTSLRDSPALKIDHYYTSLEKITDDFIKKKKFIRTYTGAKVEDSHGAALTRWAMQCTMDVYFKSKTDYMDTTGEGSKALETLMKLSKSLRLCETGVQLWRAVTTFSWLDLTENSKQMDRFIANEVNHCMSGVGFGVTSGSALEALLATEELKLSDLLTPLLDLLIININMVSSTAGFLLYNLSRTPQVQRTLFREISSVLPKGGANISQADLAKLKYLNACIIETLRMSPPFPYLSRQLDEDTRIHGFLIPRGTYIQMVNVLPCARGDACYEEIGRFQAERWTDKAVTLGGDPLAGLPTWQAHPRFNRDLVITQIALLVAKVVREYRLECPGADVYPDGMVLQGPISPLCFSFVERVV